MSLSLSVCLESFFRFEHSKHLKQDVLRELQGCLRVVRLRFKCVSKFQGSLKDVSRKLMGVNRKF